MFKTLALALVLTSAACGGGAKQVTTPAIETAEVASTGVTLSLGEMKIVDTSKHQSLMIHADGTIEIDGQKPAKVTSDGKIVTLDDSHTQMTLYADGSIKGPNGAKFGAKLGADGSLTLHDQTITIDEAGMVQGGNAAAPQLKIEGATDVNLRRTAMFVLIALMSGAEAADAPAPDAPAPDAPAPDAPAPTPRG